jgi:hypothetical protein
MSRYGIDVFDCSVTSNFAKRWSRKVKTWSGKRGICPRFKSLTIRVYLLEDVNKPGNSDCEGAARLPNAPIHNISAFY